MTAFRPAERPAANGEEPTLHRSENIVARSRDRLLAGNARIPLVVSEGSGTRVRSADGHSYLDFLSGIAVASLGHAHPDVADAIDRQARTLVHASNLYVTEPMVALAERLAELLDWPDAKAFFGNSGAEANEAALKLARRHGLDQSPDKYRVVALEGSFHGRTLATLEATGQAAKHARFAPLAGFVDHVPYDDADALRAAVDERTSAVLLEVIQGEGGVRTVPEEVLRAAREACDEHGALLIIDEVQTGVARTGTWFAFQQTPIVPDVITLAKALGNGMPIGVCVARGAATGAFSPGDHASTFGGNPVACAAALAVIEVIERDGLVGAAVAAGERLRDHLDDLVRTAPFASGVRGAGLLLGLALDTPIAGDLEEACRDRGLLVNAVLPDVVRFAPPLVVSDEDIDEAVTILADSLHEAANDPENLVAAAAARYTKDA